MTGTPGVPFLDLIGPHALLQEELCEVFRTALRTAGFIGGPMVEEFEGEFAHFCDAEHCIGVGNGTDAVRFALIAAGIGAGEVVITTPNTFIATTEAISQAGGRPVLVDIDERTYNIDVAKLQDYLERECRVDETTGRLRERNTKSFVAAIVPVHLYGQMADMDPILELAERYRLKVIEDACQAHGAEYFSKKANRWRKAGSLGHAAAFSFYPGKNLGACGEAGAVTTNDKALAVKVRRLRDHGQVKKYYHDIEGYNGRLDSIQAGILSVKLKHLAGWNEQRRAAASRYHDLLRSCSTHITLPYEPAWSRSVHHLFPIRVTRRDDVQSHLTRAGIGTAIHYPIPLHLQNAYAHLPYNKGDFPVTERVAAELLSLPIYPGLQAQQQSRVAQQLIEFVGTRTVELASVGGADI
jgi:dTDP-4-amino-4,6-dideoxygalactose transaminase